MSKHKPATSWFTRLSPVGPYQYVSTTEDKKIKLAFFPGNRLDGVAVHISRRDARLLARRINQCLDETR